MAWHGSRKYTRLKKCFAIVELGKNLKSSRFYFSALEEVSQKVKLNAFFLSQEKDLPKLQMLS